MGLTKYRNVTDLKEAEYIKKKLEEYTEETNPYSREKRETGRQGKGNIAYSIFF